MFSNDVELLRHHTFDLIANVLASIISPGIDWWEGAGKGGR